MDRKTNILVVDDEEIVRLSYSRTLTSACRNVEVAGNGIEALRVMERHPFDVILLDLRMPGMDGMTVLKMIKEKWPECQVVVITGYPSVETAKEAVRLGAHDYLAKPVGPDDVISAANGAMVQKEWALHRDYRNQDERNGSSTGYRSNPAH
ncbi:MAG: response regulator [Betaproteobacteria bacterium]|nr:response regulator [Betaproteobacteria bacterium]